jgi:hypothetical protein
MAAITTVDMAGQAHKLVETIAITDQSPTASVTKAIAVPKWANHATVVIGTLTMAGTSPLFDFALYGVDVAGGGGGAPDDGDLYALGGWDGITQKTAAAGTFTSIDIGPEYAADDTGSATATDRYGVQAALPEWLAYTYTVDGTTGDEDYSGTISVYFRA